MNTVNIIQRNHFLHSILLVLHAILWFVLKSCAGSLSRDRTFQHPETAYKRCL